MLSHVVYSIERTEVMLLRPLLVFKHIYYPRYIYGTIVLSPIVLLGHTIQQYYGRCDEDLTLNSFSYCCLGLMFKMIMVMDIYQISDS